MPIGAWTKIFPGTFLVSTLNYGLKLGMPIRVFCHKSSRMFEPSWLVSFFVLNNFFLARKHQDFVFW